MSLKRRPPVGNVRRVTAIGQNMRGVMTNKAGRVVQFESFLERSLLLSLDRDPTVQDYGSQPEMFHFSDDRGKRHTYTPDFIVWRCDGSVEIHEVTLTSRRSRPAACLREAAATAICKRRGWQYIVHTESDLPQDIELANLLALYHYRPSAYAHIAVARAILEHLADGQPVTTDQIIRRLITESGLSQASIISTLCHMLWRGHLETDLHQPIFSQGSLSPWVTLRLMPEEVLSWPAH
jgi:hypothetical protein